MRELERLFYKESQNCEHLYLGMYLQICSKTPTQISELR